MATINKNGTNGTNGTAGNPPTAGTNGGAATFTQNGQIGTDSTVVNAVGGTGGAGGAGTLGGAGANGGDGGNASITFNGNILNAPSSTTLAVQLNATGGNGGAAGLGTPPGTAGKGGNATVTANGNIFQPNKVLTSMELSATATGGAGSIPGNATSTINGNIFQTSKAVTTVKVAATAQGGGTNSATVNGNIVQGNISNVIMSADAPNGTAAINGNIIQTNATNTGLITVEATGAHIAITNNKFQPGLQEFDLTVNPTSPYDTTISGNDFKGTGTNDFVFTDNAAPGTDTIAIDLGAGTLTFDGKTNTISGFDSIAVKGTGVSAHLTGGPGNDTLTGTDGDDVIDGGGGNDIIFGGKGNDTLTGGEGNDVLHGNDGDDVLDGGNGDDTLLGGAGDDILIVSAGTDVLDGNTDPLGDTVDFRNATAGVNANLGAAQQTFTASFGNVLTKTTLVNIQNINGSAFDDVLTGDDNNNTLTGGAGDDTLIGGKGNDTLDGTSGFDRVVYANAHTGYSISNFSGGNGTVTDLTANRDGADTLKNIDRIEFSDGYYLTADNSFHSNNPVNHTPVTQADGYTVNEDNPLTVNAANGVLANDSDADGDTLTASVVTGPAHAQSFTLNPDGSFNYTPTANFNGTDSFTYQASDGHGGMTNGTANITINAVNDPPVANPDPNYAVNEDNTLSVNAANGVLHNDTDVDGDTLTASVVTGPAHAQSFTLNPDGSFNYTPTANYNGTDTFTYQASDGHGGTSNATATITVNPVNDAPVTGADNYTINEDTTLARNAMNGVLANDSDPDGDTLTASLVTGPTHAQNFTLNPDGSFTYTPNANFNGTDSFTYQASDGHGGTANATATITINPVNDAPVAGNDSYAIQQGGSLNLPAPGILGNDTDVDGDTLTVNTASITGPSHGSLTANSDGSLTYTPTAGFHGTDSFTYKANDGTIDSNAATVTITVNAPPTTAADTYADGFNTPLSVDQAHGVLANDSDPDGDTLTASQVTGPSHASSFTLNPDGSFNYTPTAGFFGTDSFTYQASDGHGGSATATATINVASGENYFGTNGADNHTGTAGDDVMHVSAGTDTLDGAANMALGDTLTFDTATAGVTSTINSTTSYLTANGAGTTTALNFENLTGSNFDDVLTGDSGNNRLDGGNGGNDTVSFLDSASGVTVNLASGTATGDGNDTLANFDNITGSNQDDLLIGDTNANTLNGAGGNDVLVGGLGDDVLDGGTGSDTAKFSTAPTSSNVSWDSANGVWKVSGINGTDVDTVKNVEALAGPGTGLNTADTSGARILLVGGGGYASINAALAAANNGDTIMVAPGEYDESLLIDKQVNIIGMGNPGDVVIKGTFAQDNNIPAGTDVATWLKTQTQANGGYHGDTGVTVNADNVGLTNVTVENFMYDVGTQNDAERSDPTFNNTVNNLTLTGVGLQDAVNGFAKDDRTTLNNLTINGGQVSDALIGVGLYNDVSTPDDPVNHTGDAVNTVIDGTSFSNILEKGIYTETAQGATRFDNLTMTDVGNYGGVPTNGADGQNGNGIDVNLKFHTFVGTLDMTNDTLTNTGNSAGQNGAIVVEGRDDPGHSSYGAPGGVPGINNPNGDPADVSGLAVTITGGTIDGSTTGVRVGELNKSDPNDPTHTPDPAFNVIQGPDVTIDGTVITNTPNGQIDNHSQDGLITVLGGDNDDIYVSGQTATSTGSLYLQGNGGNDILVGGTGDDTLKGGLGDDTLDGGTGGSDTADYSDATQNGLVVDLGNGMSTGGGLGSDSLSDIQNVTGSSFNDTLIGDGNDNKLTGGDGNDILFGHGGSNQLTGGSGTDVAYYLGNETDYTVTDMGFGTTFISGGPESVSDGFSNLDIERIKFLSPSHVADFDNDGHGDLVTQSNMGALAVNGVATSYQPAPGTKVVGFGQFNPDGNAVPTNNRASNILLQATDGTLSVLTSTTAASPVAFSGAVLDPATNYNANWAAVATGDFNGDASADVLLWNSSTKTAEIFIVKPNSGDPVGSVSEVDTVAAPSGMGWKPIAAGDFNGDGKSDILWQNTSSKQVQISLMDGGAVADQSGSLAATGLTAVGTGDFNGDGNSDILFQNAAGQAVIWYMNGESHTGTKTVNKPSTTGTWTVAGAEDIDANGQSDVLWTDTAGNIRASELAGTTVTTASLGTVPANYHLIASTGGG